MMSPDLRDRSLVEYDDMAAVSPVMLQNTAKAALLQIPEARIPPSVSGQSGG
ncbi:hypothetical protein [Inquilinus sp. Marseille-Q2685]|uniref:hypothetical protein n=1 Tax=Inquilinus sp. Marseille-Q2685 TaxID=2866581 RepID=UPI001CE42FA1|nr:hypothetical protein [Inquilinus sp. Marseille-Q2685]